MDSLETVFEPLLETVGHTHQQSTRMAQGIKELNSIIHSLKIQQADVKTRYEEMKAACESEKHTSSQVTKELALVQRAAKILDRRMNECQKEASELRQELHGTRASAESTTRQCIQLEQQLLGTVSELEQARLTLRDVEEQLRESTAERNELQSELSTAKARVEEVEALFDGLRQKLRHSQAQLEMMACTSLAEKMHQDDLNASGI